MGLLWEMMGCLLFVEPVSEEVPETMYPEGFEQGSDAAANPLLSPMMSFECVTSFCQECLLQLIRGNLVLSWVLVFAVLLQRVSIRPSIIRHLLGGLQLERHAIRLC